jgi:DNA invertase Pin-like site-specific DNA recombinase
VPADRGPGRAWKGGLASRDAAAVAATAAAIIAVEPFRIGYAWCAPLSSAGDGLAGQLAALESVGCDRIFFEETGSAVKCRPELDRVVELACEIGRAASGRPVIVAVAELRRLARTSAELMALSAVFQTEGIRLELLTGPLSGVYDPRGAGSVLFAVLAAAADLDRDHVRSKALEGQRAAAADGRKSGRPKVFDDEMLALARTLKDQGVSVPDIAARLTLRTGKSAGRHPSLASVYRALAETETSADSIIARNSVARSYIAQDSTAQDSAAQEASRVR